MEDINKDKLVVMQRGVTNNAEPIFVLDEAFDKEVTKLHQADSVVIPGTFKPKKPGKYILEAEFHYSEGESVKKSAEITVKEEKPVLDPSVVDGLPEEVVQGAEHEVTLLVKNINGPRVIDVNINEGNLLVDTIKITYNRRDYTLEAFNRLNIKLNKGEQLKITGVYKAKRVGKDILDVKVNYKLEDDTTEKSVNFDNLFGGSTNVVSKKEAKVIIRGSVKPNAKEMKLNQEESVEFTFINESNKYPATGVEINIELKEPGKSEVKKN